MARGPRGFFIGFTLVALAIILAVAIATYLTEPPMSTPRTYIAQEGDTWENVAIRYDVGVGDLLRVNRLTQPTRPVRIGEALVIPPPSPASSQILKAHGFGALAELAGVAVSLWLAKAAGLLPKALVKRSWGLSLAIAMASYSATYAVASEPVAYVSPELIFTAMKDGFAWSALVPLLARTLRTSSRRR